MVNIGVEVMQVMKELGIPKSKGDFRPSQGYDSTRLGGSNNKHGVYEISLYNYSQNQKTQLLKNITNKLRNRGKNITVYPGHLSLNY